MRAEVMQEAWESWAAAVAKTAKEQQINPSREALEAWTNLSKLLFVLSDPERLIMTARETAKMNLPEGMALPEDMAPKIYTSFADQAEKDLHIVMESLGQAKTQDEVYVPFEKLLMSIRKAVEDAKNLFKPTQEPEFMNSNQVLDMYSSGKISLERMQEMMRSIANRIPGMARQGFFAPLGISQTAAAWSMTPLQHNQLRFWALRKTDQEPKAAEKLAKEVSGKVRKLPPQVKDRVIEALEFNGWDGVMEILDRYDKNDSLLVQADRFDQFRETLGSDTVDDLLAAFGLGPKYKPQPEKKHKCPGCGGNNAVCREVHPDTDMNEMEIQCPDCGLKKAASYMMDDTKGTMTPGDMPPPD